MLMVFSSPLSLPCRTTLKLQRLIQWPPCLFGAQFHRDKSCRIYEPSRYHRVFETALLSNLAQLVALFLCQRMLPLAVFALLSRISLATMQRDD